MRTIVVVSKAGDWPLVVPGVEVVLAKDYLTDPTWTRERGVRAYNLCRSYRYQSVGYYVSLLAAARRHRPFPGLMTVLDMKSRALVRTLDDELEARIQKSLAGLVSDRFELSVYFGRNVARRHEGLARAIFARFPAPLLRATFQRSDRWHLTSAAPIAFKDVPEGHLPVVQEAASEYFAGRRINARSGRAARYALAILFDPAEELAPSDARAVARFRSAGEEVGFGVELIGRDDYGRLAEFDALFIRETTSVNHHTFRFSQRAEAEGLVVIDDPHSILRSGNKVFQTEAFEQRDVPIPRTWITDRVDAAEVAERIGFPCVLKFPDSAFSQGVLKCADAAELEPLAARLLAESDLLLVQEFTPSEYDWRVGVLGGEALYACRYHMAKGHWQIVQKKERGGGYRYGKVEPVPLDEVPKKVVRVALKASAAIGDGLYGVDLKQLDGRVVVTEVNDNPNINAGLEDVVLKRELYLRVMRHFLAKVEARKRGGVR